jgi:DNA-binding NtrC family response regulator
MPNMGGVDLARRLMELHPNLAIILMSGHSTEDITVFAGPNNLIASLQKPFTPTLLRDKVRSTLNQRRRRLRKEAEPDH